MILPARVVSMASMLGEWVSFGLDEDHEIKKQTSIWSKYDQNISYLQYSHDIPQKCPPCTACKECPQCATTNAEPSPSFDLSLQLPSSGRADWSPRQRDPSSPSRSRRRRTRWGKTGSSPRPPWHVPWRDPAPKGHRRDPWERFADSHGTSLFFTLPRQNELRSRAF